jgi:hypothetical protein
MKRDTNPHGENAMTKNLAGWIPAARAARRLEALRIAPPATLRAEGGIYASNLVSYLASDLGLRRAEELAASLVYTPFAR